MDAQVDTGVGIDRCPEEERSAQELVPQDKREERRQTERVGRMARYESVEPSAVTIDRMHKVLEIRMVRRTEACAERLAEMRSKLVAERDGQGNR